MSASIRASLLCAALALAACGGAKSATPSALVADPSDFDGQSVAVSGTVHDPHTRKTRRGIATMYQLCDSACISVFQFGEASVTDGATASATGTFHATFGRVRQVNNVLLVGGRPGGGHWSGSAQPSGSPPPDSATPAASPS